MVKLEECSSMYDGSVGWFAEWGRAALLVFCCGRMISTWQWIIMTLSTNSLWLTWWSRHKLATRLAVWWQLRSLAVVTSTAGRACYITCPLMTTRGESAPSAMRLSMRKTWKGLHNYFTEDTVMYIDDASLVIVISMSSNTVFVFLFFAFSQ